MQRGTIVQHRSSWTLLYHDIQIRDGKRVKIRVRKKLATVGKEYPTKTSVRHLADDILAPLNRQQLQPESSLLISEYIKDFYFPSVEHNLRPSTIDGYKYISNKLKGKLDIRLRDFRTVHGQRLLREIPVGRRSLIHIKAFLSAVFKHCKQEGVLDGLNPMVDVSVPGRPAKFKGAAYTMSEIARMLEDLEPTEKLSDAEITQYLTAGDVIGVLALTGLRQSECRGLRWSDWDEDKALLNISRSVWETHVGPTKNVASENSIPVIPLLKQILERRRRRVAGKPGDYIFAGKRGAPLNFHNLENRIIKSALENSKFLKPSPNGREVPGLPGKWERDDTTGITWKGYHGFRRGLASNLLGMGVHPKLIQAILRHSDIQTTLELYAMVPDNETREALQKLEAKFAVLGVT